MRTLLVRTSGDPLALVALFRRELAALDPGVPLRDVVFAPYHWLRGSFISAFGVYGYSTIFADYWLYVLLGALTLSMCGVAMFALRRACPRDWAALTAIGVGGCVLVATGSLLLSWVDALQPQGRYLFPAFALLAAALAAGAERMPLRVARLILLLAALCSAYSFGLVALPRLAFP